ncbi:MAG: aminotransferase class III-fold pyridoxal phosphate-dependent enzyme [Marinosulfonomonas sp.]|nr:aminotransferase class III-fold pyridoxal phosphate-dependent enzyme [Marinosulfonomonas sp.]
MLKRDADVFLHQSLSSPCVSTIAAASGIWITDKDGRRYMDFHGNSVHHIGYSHPKLVAAIKAQLDDLPFAPRRFTCDPAVELAEIAPANLGKVLFTTGGSDANEVALKIARAATGRFKTISFWDSFHGAGMGAASVGGEATFRSHIAGPLMTGCEHVAPFACYRCPYNHTSPDIVTLGKALGGGILPIAACIARRDLDVCGDFAIGHYTHEKNPVTCRAALTTIGIIEEEGLIDRAAELGDYAMARLHANLTDCPIAGDIRGRGLMFGVEIVTDRAKKTAGNALAEQIYYTCMDAGLSFKISHGCVLTLSPPMTISRDDLDIALAIVETAILDATLIR